jgi:hypothetical protein
MKPGSRGPYVIRMGPRWYAALLHGANLLPELSPDLQLTCDLKPPAQLQVTYNSGNHEASSIPDEEREADSSLPATSRARANTETDTDTDTDTSGTVIEATSSNESSPREGAA